MQDKKNKRVDPNSQVHSEFETSAGNSFNIVREETGKKKVAREDDGPLNELDDEVEGGLDLPGAVDSADKGDTVDKGED
jgi:hypothetical protein